MRIQMHEKVHSIIFVHTCVCTCLALLTDEDAAAFAVAPSGRRNVKHFMIRYRRKDATKDQGHQDIAQFIAALDEDPAVKGKISVPLA